MNRILAALILLLPCAAAADPVGYREIDLPANQTQRGLHVAMWYPSQATATAMIGGNPVFIGFDAAQGAPPSPGQHRLVLLSHGYGGSAKNLGWLATALAAQGFIVAAPDHPGTTTTDMGQSGASALAGRPGDLSHLIDALSADPVWSPLIAPDRVAAIGHSLGGWTVLSSVGAQFDAARMRGSCANNPQSSICAEVRSRTNTTETAGLAQSAIDPRITMVVALDPGVTRGLDPASLAAIKVPMLVIAAGTATPVLADKKPLPLPDLAESRDLVAAMPPATTRLITLPTATHFSFLPACKPGAARYLDAEAVICADATPSDNAMEDRVALHDKVNAEISRFLAQSPPR